MLTPETFAKLNHSLESHRIERTVTVKNTDKFCEAICAFANDLAHEGETGYLFIGVNDDGTIAKTSITDDLLQNLSAIRDQGNILPAPAMLVYRLDLPEGTIAVIEVTPSDLPPVRYKGRVYIRVGPRRGIANEQEERQLSERRATLISTWDLTPVPEATLADLAWRLFDDYRQQALAPEVIEANHRTREESLAALRFFDLRKNCPTVAGLILFGTNPLHYLPGAYVQYLRFAGTSLADSPIDQQQISGDLASVIRTLHEKLAAIQTTAMTQGAGFRDSLTPAYPQWALRELLHNALMHRDYASTTPTRVYVFDDRIEIQSPGGLYPPMTPANIRRTNAYRNPVLAEAAKVLGFVNKFGHGIARADKMLADSGNPALLLEAESGFVQVTIFAHKGTAP